MELDRYEELVNEHHPAMWLTALGLIVAEVGNSYLAKRGVSQLRGIVVLGTRTGGTADLAGVTAGDIICEVDGTPVAALPEVEQRLQLHPPALPIRLLIRNGDYWRFLAIPLEERQYGGCLQ